MGCDIHLCLEVKNHKDEWVNADLYKVNASFGRYEHEKDPFLKVDVYQGRDYSLFTALCGVRDYGNDNPKISKPKGIPQDVTAFTRREVERWGGDAHSHSWNLLSELYTFKLHNSIIKESGLISVRQAEELDKLNKLPEAWCQWSSNGNLVYREWEREYSPLDTLIESIEYQLDKFYFFNCKEKADRVRIIYWFDN